MSLIDSFVNFMKLYAGDDLFSSRFKLKMQDSFLGSNPSKRAIEEQNILNIEEVVSNPGPSLKELKDLEGSKSSLNPASPSEKNRNTLLKLKSYDEVIKNIHERPLLDKSSGNLKSKESLGDKSYLNENQTGQMNKSQPWIGFNGRSKLAPISIECLNTEDIGKVGSFTENSKSIPDIDRKTSLKDPSRSIKERRLTEECEMSRKSSLGNFKVIRPSVGKSKLGQSQFSKSTAKIGLNIKTQIFNTKDSPTHANIGSAALSTKLNFLNSKKSLDMLQSEQSAENTNTSAKGLTMFNKKIVIKTQALNHKTSSKTPVHKPRISIGIGHTEERISFPKNSVPFTSSNTPTGRLVAFGPFVAPQNSTAKEAQLEEHQKLLKRNMMNRKIRILQSSINQLEKEQQLGESPRKKFYFGKKVGFFG